MTSRTKKRIVLPSRPEPPSIEQILEDVRGSAASDPVFTCDFNDDHMLYTPDMSEREKQYMQSCSYAEMNSKLKEYQVQLKVKCDSLRCAGKKLEGVIEELKISAM
uniref:Chromosome 19 open reading frame 25 n=1 Tax=Leptobrachium leishanense TaxID=445787 RepID=A0A8C5LWJ2_9ANUR